MSDCREGVPLLPPAAGEAAPPDPLAEFTVRFRALPDDLGRAPAVRVRQLLRYALRQCRLKNLGFQDVPGPPEKPAAGRG